MNKENFNFTWHTYSDHLRKMLEKLKNDERSQDVTLVCADRKKIKAHQIVLKACSPVFSIILGENLQVNPIIYLRGIQHEEIEAILQFMYLGEATCNQNRMAEFLNVAKNLEIKELSNNVELYEQQNSSELVEKGCQTVFQEPSDDSIVIEASDNSKCGAEQLENYEMKKYSDDIEFNEQKNSSEPFESYSLSGQILLKESRIDPPDNNLKTEANDNLKSTIEHDPQPINCPDCEKQFSQKGTMRIHHKSVHQGVEYPCSQCDFKAKDKGYLKKHVKSQHEGQNNCCSQCDYKTNTKVKLMYHIQSIHEAIKYSCNHCDFKAVFQYNLKAHIKAKHEGVNYPCSNCN